VRDENNYVFALRWMNSLRRKADRKGSPFKGFSRGADRTSLASYIRLFEPMVIKALKVIIIMVYFM
jgi:hypothetical protein